MKIALALVLSAVSAVAVTPATAADYCWITAGRAQLVDGGTVVNTGKVVISSVPRPDYPGKGPNRPWCVQTRSSLGGHGSSKVVVAPRLGEVKVSSYTIAYKGDRLGHDRFVVERTWIGPRNEQFRGTLIYEVDVVAEPF